MFDVIIIGAGPSGLYSSIVLKRGIPTQSIEEKDISVCVLEKGNIGGLTRYAHIQICKSWSFSGSNLVSTLYKECKQLNVNIQCEQVVKKIIKKEKFFEVYTNKNLIKSKFVILANGIMSVPESLSDKRVIIGLHNADQMIKDIKAKKWKKIILYGNYIDSLEKLKEELLNYSCLDEVNIIIEPLGTYKSGYAKLYVDEKYMKIYDGIVIDYNSYKVINGSTSKIEIPGLKKDLGFTYTDAFCETNINNLYAVGTTSNIITGIPISISTAQIAAIDIGRKLKKNIISEPTGRFPWYPREDNWDESWLKILKNTGNN